MSMLVNPFIYGAAPSFYHYAVADGSNADIYDPGGLHASGTFTVPAAWNGRKVRAMAQGRNDSGGAVTMSMALGGSNFDGAGAASFPAITGQPDGGFITSAPVVVATGDTFTFSGTVASTDGNWKFFEVLPSGVKGALVNRTSTFSVGTAFTNAQWDNEIYDTDGYFTTGSPTVFTMDSGTSGLVRVCANVSLTSPGTEMGLLLTGGVTGNMEIDSTGSELCIMSPPLARSSGQTVKLSIRTQSATTMAVDNNTWMSIEELDAGLQYAIARLGSNIAVASGSTWVAISPSIEDVDVGGWYTAGQDHFTVPSGVSQVRCGFFAKSTNSLGSAWAAGIFLNNSDFNLIPYNGQTNASVECIHAVSPFIQVTAGDTLDFYARTAAGSMSMATNSFFWVEEVPAVTS